MKIAFFCNLTPGGADRALFEILKRLSLRHKIDFYNPDTKAKKRKLLIEKIPVKQFSFKINLSNNFFLDLFFIYTKLFKIHKQIAQIINSRGYDVALISDDYLTKTPLLLRFLKIPSVYFCQTHYREFYDSGLIFSRVFKHRVVNFLRYPLKWINEKSFQKATLVVANSKYIQKRLREIHKRKIYKIKLGVESKYSRRKKGKSFGREDFFLSVGPLAIFKGMDFLIKAISYLPKNERLPLVIVSNGGRDEKHIKRLAKDLKVRLKIKRGIWEGIDDPRLIGLYNRAKLFLYASYNEPFGLVILEAMSCGLPVVGVNEGGLKETIIEGKNGWLSERDVKKFSLRIRKGLKEVNKGLRKKTRDSTKTWDWNKSALMLEKILYKAVKEKTNNEDCDC